MILVIIQIWDSFMNDDKSISEIIKEAIKNPNKEPVYLHPTEPTLEQRVNYLRNKFNYDSSNEIFEYLANGEVGDEPPIICNEYFFDRSNHIRKKLTGIDEKMLSEMLEKYQFSQIEDWLCRYNRNAVLLQRIYKDIYNLNMLSYNTTIDLNRLNINLQTNTFLYNSIEKENDYIYSIFEPYIYY